MTSSPNLTFSYTYLLASGWRGNFPRSRQSSESKRSRCSQWMAPIKASFSRNAWSSWSWPTNVGRNVGHQIRRKRTPNFAESIFGFSQTIHDVLGRFRRHPNRRVIWLRKIGHDYFLKSSTAKFAKIKLFFCISFVHCKQVQKWGGTCSNLRRHSRRLFQYRKTFWGFLLQGEKSRIASFTMKNDQTLMIKKRHHFLRHFVTTSLLETDQVLLMRYFWPWAKTMMLQHDSFHCDLFAKSRAWPSQRPEGLNNFVGVPVSLNSTLTDECPLRCRPREHPEWKQCWASIRQRPNEPKCKGRYRAKVPSSMTRMIPLNSITITYLGMYI